MGRWTAPSPSPRCPACTGPVYPAEAFMASDRTPFHKSCVRCVNCKKTLTSNTLNEHMLQLYCRTCYEDIIKPKVTRGAFPAERISLSFQAFHAGNYGGLVEPGDFERREEEKKREREKAERKKKEKRCPKCDRRSYPDDSVRIDDVYFHKVCLKCFQCGSAPGADTPMVVGPREEKQEENLWSKEEDLVPYCKFCFAKKFKISILNIQETVQTMPEASGVSL